LTRAARARATVYVTGVASLGLGAVSVLGFAPYYLHGVPVCAVAALFVLWQRAASASGAAAIGFLYGLGLYGTGVSWIYISLHDYGGMPAAIAVSAMVIFCSVYSLFPALTGFAVGRLRAHPVWACVFLGPGLWTLTEWVRSWLFTGFPWLAMLPCWACSGSRCWLRFVPDAWPWRGPGAR
jgi:apolipoprotein N-acyltransferase